MLATIAVMALLTTMVTGAGTAAAQGDATITVTPSSLTETTRVHVSATMTLESDQFIVFQCAPGAIEAAQVPEFCSYFDLIEGNGLQIEHDWLAKSEFTSFDGTNTIDCVPVVCEIAVSGFSSGETVSAPITFSSEPTFAATPNRDLTTNQILTVSTTNSFLASEPGAVAFTMQCAFKKLAPGGFVCGPTGTVRQNFAGTFSGTLTINEAFVGDDGVTVTCDRDAVCVAVVAVIRADSTLIGGAGVVLDFARDQTVGDGVGNVITFGNAAPTSPES